MCDIRFRRWVVMCSRSALPVYFVAGLLALTTAVGEGLHWLPGMGHAVEISGRLVLKGVTGPSPSAPAGGGCALDGARTLWPPIRPEQDCPVCRICAENLTIAEASLLCQVMPLVHDPSPTLLCDVPGGD